MIKLLLPFFIFLGQAQAATSIFNFCKSQLKDNSYCEIFAPKKNKNIVAKTWIKNLKKSELEMKKTLLGMDELKNQNNLKANQLMELKKELDVAKAHLVYRVDEVKGLKGQLDNIRTQLTAQTEETKRVKKNYDEIDKKFNKFSSEYYIQNRVTIVLGILFVLTLFLLIKKAKEFLNAKKEIYILRAKLKDLSITTEEDEFPVLDPIAPVTQKENPVSPIPQ